MGWGPFTVHPDLLPAAATQVAAYLLNRHAIDHSGEAKASNAAKMLLRPHSRRPWKSQLEQVAAAMSATTRRRAMSAESKTQTSRNQGTPGHRATASWEDGSGCDDNCDTTGSRQELQKVLQTGISDNSWDTPEAKTSEKANLQPEEKLTLIFSVLFFNH